MPDTHISSLYEYRQHGTLEFPYVVYHFRIPDSLYSCPMHWHDEMELMLVQSGCCTVTLNKVPFTAHAGDIVPILPGMLHAIEQLQEDTCEYFSILFDLKMLGQDSPSDYCYTTYIKPYLAGSVSLPYRIASDHPQHDSLLEILSPLTRTVSESSRGYELFVKSQLYRIFWLFESLEERKLHSSPDRLQLSQVKKIKELLLFIHSNYASSLSLKEAADFCGYSVSYFTKFFKSFTGMTLIEYLNHYRLEKACELLLTTDLSVIEISENTGFENHSYFIRSFRRQYQMTPLKYRRAGTGKEQL
ncbi:MAG: AraC family transcriptional regulator [Bariatricus sp.]